MTSLRHAGCGGGTTASVLYAKRDLLANTKKMPKFSSIPHRGTIFRCKTRRMDLGLWLRPIQTPSAHPIASKLRLLGVEKCMEQVTLPVNMSSSFHEEFICGTSVEGNKNVYMLRVATSNILFASVTGLSN